MHGIDSFFSITIHSLFYLHLSHSRPRRHRRPRQPFSVPSTSIFRIPFSVLCIRLQSTSSASSSLLRRRQAAVVSRRQSCAKFSLRRRANRRAADDIDSTHPPSTSFDSLRTTTIRYRSYFLPFLRARRRRRCPIRSPGDLPLPSIDRRRSFRWSFRWWRFLLGVLRILTRCRSFASPGKSGTKSRVWGMG